MPAEGAARTARALDEAAGQLDRGLDLFAAAEMAETLTQLDQLVWNAWSKKTRRILALPAKEPSVRPRACAFRG